MKYFKYSFLILAFAVIADFVLTKSVASDYPVVSSLTITPHLDKNNGQYTDYRTKTKTSTMSYNHTSSITTLSNPCNDCQVAAKPVTEGGTLGTQ